MHTTLILLALLSSPAPTPAGPQVLNLPGPPEQQLLLGAWTLKVTYAPSKKLPRGGQGTGTVTWRAGPDGRSLIEELQERGDAGAIEGIGIAWYDAVAGGQRFVWCETGDPAGCTVSASVARWEAKALVYSEVVEQGGTRVRREEIFQDITPDSFLQLLKEGPADGEAITVVTIHASRVPPRTLPSRPRP